MLGNLKKKINNAIQEGIVISESLQHQYRQRVSTPSTPVSTASKTLGDSRSSSRSSLSMSQFDLGVPAQLNVAAGCNLLAKYEDDWQTIHSANEENAEQSAKVAAQIAQVGQRATAQRVAMMDLITCLSGIPALVSKLNEGMSTLQEIATLSEQVEQELQHLENLCEECDLQEFMLEKQCTLSQYKQKKMMELESYRQKVAAEHQLKIRKHEERLRQIQRDRQAAFDDAFRVDLAEYRQNGGLTKIQQDNSNTLSLEEVTLEDTETKDALEEFLNG